MGIIKNWAMNSNIDRNDKLKAAAKRATVTPPSRDLDTCEMCGETAVCRTVTVEVSQEYADMLVCDHCHSGLIFQRMGMLARQRVDQLRGEYDN